MSIHDCFVRAIFVFGSNLAGRHGKGAALHALKNYGAVYGVGEGLTGNAYAIPTKDHDLKVRSLRSIEHSITIFYKFVLQNPDMIFILTPIGSGYAGFSVEQIRILFQSINGLKI